MSTLLLIYCLLTGYHFTLVQARNYYNQSTSHFTHILPSTGIKSIYTIFQSKLLTYLNNSRRFLIHLLQKRTNLTRKH